MILKYSFRKIVWKNCFPIKYTHRFVENVSSFYAYTETRFLNLVSWAQSAEGGARVGAQRRRTRSHACSSARSVVLNACVCLREPMETSRFAPATITGRPREEDPNALENGNTNYYWLPTLLVLCLLFCFLHI